MEYIRQHRGLFIFEGILFIILGILAIAVPQIFTLGVALLIGWLFVIGAIIQGYRTIQMSGRKGWIPSLFMDFVYLVIGIVLLVYPLTGIITLTILLIAFFIIEGIAKIVLGIELRPIENWGWLVFSGLISLAMAAIIIIGWPATAGWVIGLLVGINMLFYGITLLFLTFSGEPTSRNFL